MHTHLIPDLFTWEWVLIAVLILLFAYGLRKHHKANEVWIREQATHADVNSITESIGDDLVAKLVAAVPAAIDKQQRSELARVRNEVAALQQKRDNDPWILIRVTVHGFTPPNETAGSCYVAIYQNVETGALAPAPANCREITDYDKHDWDRRPGWVIPTELGAPPYKRITGHPNNLLILGVEYRWDRA